MKKYIFLISIFLYINIPIFSQTQKPGTSKTTTQKVVDTGKKVINKVMELFALPHTTPKNYIPISTIELTDKNNFKNIEIQKNRTPELELKVLYPRITPEKGFVSFQLGDFNYYRYIKNIEKSNIDYIKLIAPNGDECFVEKYRILPKKELERHIVFLLDHSGSMGKNRASELQKSVVDAITKNATDNSKTLYSVYKFSNINRLIVSSKSINEIQNALLPTNGLDGFGGGTAIKDALLSSVDLLSLDNKSENKIIVIFTDGQSNSDLSIVPMNDVIKKALDNNINIITVGFGSYLDPNYLENISSNSGGNLYHIYNPKEFDILFSNIFNDIKFSYDLEFSPCMFGDKIKIEIKLNGFEKPILGNAVFRSPPLKGFSIDQNLLFDNSSATINPTYFSKLNNLAEFLQKSTSVNILIEGHTDKLGDESNNITLSLKRAQSVKNYLIERGVNTSRISVKGFGSSKPVYEYNDNSNVNALNRRIQIVIN